MSDTLPHPTALADIEAELQRQQCRGQGDEPLSSVRAWLSNIVIFCNDDDELLRVARDVQGIAGAHPSRIIVLAVSPAANDEGIEAWVRARSERTASSPGGQRNEFVLLRCSLKRSGGLPAAARSLLIGDLPTALWWTPTDQSPPHYGQLFDSLSAMADHVIYDSRGWIDAPPAVSATAKWAAHAHPGLAISDLAWRRLEPWRSVIGQSLDPARVPGALAGIDELVIEHGPHALPQAWLLIGWMADRLGWRIASGTLETGVEVTWNFESSAADSARPIRVKVRRNAGGEPMEIEAVSIQWTTAVGGVRVTDRERLERLAHERIGVMGEPGVDGPRVVAVPLRKRSELVAGELPQRGPRPLFCESLQRSRVMAEALMH